MSELEIETTMRRLIGKLAPDAELGSLDREADLRDALDLDSMDFLNLVRAVKAETGVEIPEADYRAVRSLAGLVRYVAIRL